jgi:hypothetical protein
MHHFNFGSGAFGGSSGAAPLRGGSHLRHSASSANLHSQAQNQQQEQQRQPRLRVAAAAAAAATAGATGMHLHRQGQLSLPFSTKQQQQRAAEAGKPFLIPRELAEVMAGAFAEIIQVAALYPIDTIKVGHVLLQTLCRLPIDADAFVCFCTHAAALCGYKCLMLLASIAAAALS